MNKLLFLLLLSLCTLGEMAAIAQPLSYRYRVALRDKKGSPYSLLRPEEFLSPRAIERRARFGFRLDEHVRPIPPAYLQAIQATGARVLNASKWNNTVQIEVTDTTLRATVAALPFVRSTTMVYAPPKRKGIPTRDDSYRENRAAIINTKVYKSSHPYGVAQTQNEMLQTHLLHQSGYKGKGLQIAVIDGGFYNVDLLPHFQSTRILSSRNFAHPDRSVYEESHHGTMVLSCMAANSSHQLVGTAPEASYHLIVSEDTEAEYLGEEDNWCAAIEYADSLGADLVNTSLGYHHYDAPQVELQYAWLDGQTQLISRSASLAASRGLLLCQAAGNEGDDPWKKIAFPADAHHILTVGAVDARRRNTAFSGVGHTAHGRIKPDAMAMGGLTKVIDQTGKIVPSNGTSFACPVLAGAVACLWQAFPTATPHEIIKAVQQSSDRYQQPNEVYGYGIPDLWKAYQLLQQEQHHRQERIDRLTRDDW